MIHENTDAFVFQTIYNTRTQIDDPFICIIERTHPHFDMLLLFFGKIGQEQIRCFLCSQYLEFVSILDIHNLITDVICGFHQIFKRIADETQFTLFCRKLFYPQLTCNSQVAFFLCPEKTELSFFSLMTTRVRIFHDRGKCTVCHHKTALSSSLKMMGKQTKSIRISLKTSNIIPLCLRKPVSCVRTHIVSQFLAVTLAEISSYRIFSAMSEWRIPQIVSQTRSRNNTT